LLFEGRYKWLAVAAFLYVWTYHLFAILGAMAVLWTLTIWWTEGRREWRPILWTGIGFAAGFVLNPYFPNDLRLFWEHLSAKAGSVSLAPGAGTEWYAPPSWQLLTSSLVAFVAMLAGYISFGFVAGRHGRRGIERPLFLLLFATLLLVLTARSRRFVEYWPPCAVLFAAFTLQSAGESAVVDPQKRAGKTLPAPEPWRPSKLQGAVGVVILFTLSFYQVDQARRLVATPTIPDQYRGGTQWLLDHVPSGAIVFNASWDDFPKLFYYDQSHAYVSGLDPIYLVDQNADLGRLYERIVTGKQRRSAKGVHQAFAADYVFVTPAADRSFYVSAMLSGEYTKVYEDQQCMILKIRDADADDR
jgi:hypothetical protein